MDEVKKSNADMDDNGFKQVLEPVELWAKFAADWEQMSLGKIYEVGKSDVDHNNIMKAGKGIEEANVRGWDTVWKGMWSGCQNESRSVGEYGSSSLLWGYLRLTIHSYCYPILITSRLLFPRVLTLPHLFTNSPI